MKQNSVTIGLVQMRSSRLPELNVAKAIKKIRETANQGVRIICLQELFRTDYFPQIRSKDNFRFSESIPGPTTDVFSRLARKLSVVLIVPVFEKHSKNLHYNSAIVIDADGRTLGLYRKMHLPNDPYFYEKFYFKPGNSGFQAYKTRYGTIGVLICWDQWFPEAARALALTGAEILFYPTTIGWLAGERKEARLKELDAWKTIQRSHSIANGVYVAAVNRVGREGKITFWGNSFVSDPFGRVIAQAGKSREETLVIDCDLSEIRKIRRAWPFLKERRVDAYGMTNLEGTPCNDDAV